MPLISSQILSENISYLMAERRWSKRELSQRSGVSPRMVAYVLTQERKCTLDVLDALSGAFGVPSWILLTPNISGSYKELERLLRQFDALPQESREFVSTIISREIS